MLVQPNEVLPHRPLPLLYNITLGEILKAIPQSTDRRDMEFVLMRFEVAQLSKVLPTLVKLASVRFS